LSRLLSTRLAILLLSLLYFELGAFGKDELEAFQQFGVLIVEAACRWKVRPLHVLTQREHSDDRHRSRDRLASNKVPSLLG